MVSRSTNTSPCLHSHGIGTAPTLGRFRESRVSNYQLMMDLIEYCRNHTIQQILDLPDVKERVELYQEQEMLHRAQVEKCAKVHGNLVVLHLRDEDPISRNHAQRYAHLEHS